MLYKKYKLEDCNIELMIPSNYIYNQNSYQLSKHEWQVITSGIKISLNIQRFNSDTNSNQKEALVYRLQDYYLEYKTLLNSFNCRQVLKKNINGRDFGEIIYTAKFKSYKLLNCILTGIVENIEVSMSLQCFAEDYEYLEHLFSNIIDSIKIIGNGGEADAD